MHKIPNKVICTICLKFKPDSKLFSDIKSYMTSKHNLLRDNFVTSFVFYLKRLKVILKSNWWWKFSWASAIFFELWNLCSPVLLRNSFFLLIQGSINILEGLLKGAHNLVSSPYFLVNPAHSALFPSKSWSHPLFKNNNKSNWHTRTPTHDLAGTLPMRTTISPGQWQPRTAVSALLGLISMA